MHLTEAFYYNFVQILLQKQQRCLCVNETHIYAAIRTAESK